MTGGNDSSSTIWVFTFIPNLLVSERLPSTRPGVVRVRQVGASISPLWRLEAQATLDLETGRSLSGARILRFTQQDGDFERFVGKWVLEPIPKCPGSTLLLWQVDLVPRRLLPAALVARLIAAGLPPNLQAVAIEARARFLAGSGAWSWS